MFFRVVFVTCLLALVSANPITGGIDAKKRQFPHQVSLQYSNNPRHRCGGAILSKIWILTATHCVIDQPIIVIKAGKVNIMATEATEQIVEVERVFVHENFTRTPPKRNDIALLKLARPLTFNKDVNKIGLPDQGKQPTGRAVVSGWGSVSRTAEPSFPQILQTATLLLLDALSCQQVYRRIDPEWQSRIIDPNNVCTAPGSAYITTCIGDSGGPLIQRGSLCQGDKIVGIVSYGPPLCGTAKPSVYTKVSSFVNWIKDKMEHN